MLENAPKTESNNAIIKLMIELMHSGKLKSVQDDYLYWDTAKYKAKSKGISAPTFWSVIKLHRRINAKQVQFGNYQFNYLITDYIQKSLHQFDLHIGGTLGSSTGIAETDKNKYIISSIMEEAISSSQMEGANTTRKQAKDMIQKELKPKTVSEQMIMNNYVTMRYIVQHKHNPLTPESLLHIHSLVTKNTLTKKEEEGVFRKNNDIYVVDHVNSEIVHTPPNKSELKVLIKDLCAFFNEDEKDFIHPIIKGIIIHFMIAWIHPFTDGNGRTARALFYWYMLKKGYWLTEYLSISRIIKGSKTQYEKAYLYTEIDEKDLTYFITYHVKTMDKAYAALKEYIGHKQNEVVQAARFMKIPKVNERMAQLLKVIYEDPDRVFNSKEIEKRFNVSNFTARADLKQLVKLGFLEVIQVNKIKQHFVKSSKFDSKMQQLKMSK